MFSQEKHSAAEPWYRWKSGPPLSDEMSRLRVPCVSEEGGWLVFGKIREAEGSGHDTSGGYAR